MRLCVDYVNRSVRDPDQRLPVLYQLRLRAAVRRLLEGVSKGKTRLCRGGGWGGDSWRGASAESPERLAIDLVL